MKKNFLFFLTALGLGLLWAGCSNNPTTTPAAPVTVIEPVTIIASATFTPTATPNGTATATPVPPPSVINGYFSTGQNTPVTLSNSTLNSLVTLDPNGDQLIFFFPGTPGHGTVSLVHAGPTNTVTYTPNAGFYGSDSFSYYAHDQVTNLDSPVQTMVITVVAPPTATFSPTITFTPTATDTPVTILVTPTWTLSFTPTNSPTVTPSFTPTGTSTSTATYTNTPTPNATVCSTPSQFGDTSPNPSLNRAGFTQYLFASPFVVPGSGGVETLSGIQLGVALPGTSHMQVAVYDPLTGDQLALSSYQSVVGGYNTFPVTPCTLIQGNTYLLGCFMDSSGSVSTLPLDVNGQTYESYSITGVIPGNFNGSGGITLTGSLLITGDICP